MYDNLKECESMVEVVVIIPFKVSNHKHQTNLMEDEEKWKKTILEQGN